MSGALHISLDMYQSDNRQDYLGIVLYHQVVKRETIHIKQMVLECLGFGTHSHTGKQLVHTTCHVLQKFEIKHRLGLGCHWQWHIHEQGHDEVYCLAHVLNLAAQAVAALFHKPLACGPGDDGDDDEDNEDEDELDNERNGDKNNDVSGGVDCAKVIEDEDVDLDNLDGDTESWALDPDDAEQGADDFDEEVKDYDLPEIVPGSDDADKAKAMAK
ncbi:hypothetical protein FRC06_006825, partial [Ceratobasidium sp. 370]